MATNGERLDKIYEVVIEGNGKGPLTTRTQTLEDQVKELIRIVKGDGEKKGLQPQMIALNSKLALLNWLIVTLIAALMIWATIFAGKLGKVTENRTQPVSTAYAE